MTYHQLDPNPPALQLYLQSVGDRLALGQEHQTSHPCCPESDRDVVNLQLALNFLVQAHEVVATELNSGCTYNINSLFVFCLF